MDEAIALNELGRLVWLRGNLEAAQQHFEQLLRIGQLQGSPGVCEAAWNNLAAIHRERGDTVHAALCQQQAAKLLHHLEGADSHLEGISCHLSNRANDAILAGDFRLAERLLRTALNCDRLGRNRSGQADDWGGLGIVASLTGDYVTARRRFLRAFWFHAGLGDHRGTGIDLKHLAELDLAQGDLQAARRHINLALAHFERAGCAGLAQAARRTSREISSRERVVLFDPTRN